MRTDTFWSHVAKTDDCWAWTGGSHKGYGRYAGRAAHRVAYELARGPVPDGLELDHTCRTPLCVRPDHLDAVDRVENMRRRYATQTHCVNGHLFSDANTYVWNGHRACRTCRAAASTRRAAARRAA